MAGKTKAEGGLKLGRVVAESLTAWLKSRGIPRSRLAGAIGMSDQQAVLVFKGSGYVSENQRETIETFTEGAITVEMLEGKVAPPRSFERPEDDEVDVDGGDSGDLATGAGESPEVAAALRVFMRNLRKASSDGERRRSAQALIDYVRGKPRQAEKDKAVEAPIHEQELLDKLTLIEERLKQEEEAGGGSGI